MKPHRSHPADPDKVHTVSGPKGPPTGGELGSPTRAAAGWLARWCGFDYRQGFGVAELRARAAMTRDGWLNFDPRASSAARASWRQTVAAKETAACSRPAARINPEAPRDRHTAVVLVTAQRVVHPAGGRAYVEPVRQQRVLSAGHDGRWRVDAATDGG